MGLSYVGTDNLDMEEMGVLIVQAAGQAEEMLLSNPHIRHLVWFSALDEVRMMEAYERIRPQGVSIFAFDDLEDTKEGIRQYRIVSTIVQQPHEMEY